MSVHQRVIRIGHHDLMAKRLQVLRHPFTFSRGLDQDAGVWATQKQRRQPFARRRDTTVDDVAALRQDPHLTFFFMQVDRTILHSWSPLLHCRVRLRTVERTLPPHEGGQPLHHIFGTGDGVPANLTSRAAAARRARVEANRSAACQTCPKVDAAA